MILGIGIDLVELNRIEKLVNNRFIDRILSDDEKIILENMTDDQTKLSFIGGRFAAKEALFKAISKGPGTTNYKDFSVLNEENGKPFVKTNFFKNNEIIHVTITHTNAHAIAYVMIEKL